MRDAQRINQMVDRLRRMRDHANQSLEGESPTGAMTLGVTREDVTALDEAIASLLTPLWNADDPVSNFK